MRKVVNKKRTTKPEDRDILDIDQASEYLSVSRSTLYKLIQRGAVPHMKIGGGVRFSRRMLLEWVEEESRKNLKQEREPDEE
jgi:excisionase family DNA binding protein